jgi:hypothetical protein
MYVWNSNNYIRTAYNPLKNGQRKRSNISQKRHTDAQYAYEKNSQSSGK